MSDLKTENAMLKVRIAALETENKFYENFIEVLRSKFTDEEISNIASTILLAMDDEVMATKCGKGIVGSPKFSVGDIIDFDHYNEDGEVEILTGSVYIVDKYGTFEQDDEPSYDIMTEIDYNGTPTRTLVKHIAESRCYSRGV